MNSAIFHPAFEAAGYRVKSSCMRSGSESWHESTTSHQAMFVVECPCGKTEALEVHVMMANEAPEHFVALTFRDKIAYELKVHTERDIAAGVLPTDWRPPQ